MGGYMGEKGHGQKRPKRPEITPVLKSPHENEILDPFESRCKKWPFWPQHDNMLSDTHTPTQLPYHTEWCNFWPQDDNPPVLDVRVAVVTAIFVILLFESNENLANIGTLRPMPILEPLPHDVLPPDVLLQLLQEL